MQLKRIFEVQQKHFTTNFKTNHSERVFLLEKLRTTILDLSPEIEEALYLDLGRHKSESRLVEIFPIISEIKYVKKNLKKWMKPQKVKTPIILLGSKSFLHYEPKGNSLIISPFNYPFLLSFLPIISAVAAGAPFILKPSDKSVNTSEILEKIISEVFDVKFGCVALGGIEVSQELLNFPFKHIYFTGSTSVGKIVMENASKHLASVTLELGGKSPAIILKDADLEKVVNRLVWGKMINIGQTCIAPDYVLVHSSLKEKLIELVSKRIESIYSEKPMLSDENYGRLIDIPHFDRINELVEDALEKGAKKIVLGDDANRDKRFFPPVVLTDTTFDMKVMNEEIFGPVLPVLSFENDDEILKVIAENPYPLAVYIFGKDKLHINKLIANNPSGGVVVNDVLIQIINKFLPFGGVNYSGLGKGKGRYGFEEFSNAKPVITNNWLIALKIFFPPYKKLHQKLIDILIKYF